MQKLVDGVKVKLCVLTSVNVHKRLFPWEICKLNFVIEISSALWHLALTIIPLKTRFCLKPGTSLGKASLSFRLLVQRLNAAPAVLHSISASCQHCQNCLLSSTEREKFTLLFFCPSLQVGIVCKPIATHCRAKMVACVASSHHRRRGCSLGRAATAVALCLQGGGTCASALRGSEDPPASAGFTHASPIDPARATVSALSIKRPKTIAKATDASVTCGGQVRFSLITSLLVTGNKFIGGAGLNLIFN